MTDQPQHEEITEVLEQTATAYDEYQKAKALRTKFYTENRPPTLSGAYDSVEEFYDRKKNLERYADTHERLSDNLSAAEKRFTSKCNKLSNLLDMPRETTIRFRLADGRYIAIHQGEKYNTPRVAIEDGPTDHDWDEALFDNNPPSTTKKPSPGTPQEAGPAGP